MNLQVVYAPDGGASTLPRPESQLVSKDHKLICLGYEQALAQGWDATYHRQGEGDCYCLAILDCSLTQFCEILIAASAQRHRPASDVHAGQATREAP